MSNKKLFSTVLLSFVMALQAVAYTVTPADDAPLWQIDWSYNQARPDWQEPQASAFSDFAVMIVTVEEALQPYATADDLMAIFVGDELRGLARPLVMGDGRTDATRFLLKAYSNEGYGDQVVVAIKYYNAQLQQLFTLSESMTLDENSQLGITDDFVPPFTLGSAKYPVATTLDVADILAGVTPAEGDVVAAFVGDECRGLWTAPGDGSGLSVYLTSEDEDVVVKYYDATRHRILTFDGEGGGEVSGDVNGDGQVNGTDVVALTNIILGKGEKTAAADVNGDGLVNGTDYVALVNIVLGKGDARSATRPRRAATRAAGETALSIEPFDIQAGETQEMVIALTNPDDQITLVQFDLRLPAGLSVKITDGDYDFDIAGRTTWRKHSLDANELPDGAIRFLLASSSNAVLSDAEGAIIKITLVADSRFTGGDILLENILMVTPEEKEFKQETLSCFVGTAAPEPTPGVVQLSVEDFAIAAGGEAEIVIDLTNPTDQITLVQFDLRLPAGLSVKTTDGEYDFDIAGRTTWRKHSLDANELPDGAIRFLLASSSNAVLSGTEGAIIRITVEAGSDYNYEPVRVENILLVAPDETEFKPDVIEFTPASSGGGTVAVDAVTASAAATPGKFYGLNGCPISGKPSRAGVYINIGNKVVVK